jgi:hypothetical protein
MSYTHEEILDHRSALKTALYSDEFEQGTGWLVSRAEKYCCLGVACEIAKEDLGLVKQESVTSRDYGVVDDYGLPKIIYYNTESRKEWTSFLGPKGLHYYGFSEPQQMILVVANDNGLSFETIAEIIDLMEVYIDGKVADSDGTD